MSQVKRPEGEASGRFSEHCSLPGQGVHGAKPLLGLANTVQCQGEVRLGLGLS